MQDILSFPFTLATGTRGDTIHLREIPKTDNNNKGTLWTTALCTAKWGHRQQSPNPSNFSHAGRSCAPVYRHHAASHLAQPQDCAHPEQRL